MAILPFLIGAFIGMVLGLTLGFVFAVYLVKENIMTIKKVTP